jgi:hypothetical protein
MHGVGEGDLVGDVGAIVVMSVGGVVQVNASGARSGSKGELDGDEKGLSVML